MLTGIKRYELMRRFNATFRHSSMHDGQLLLPDDQLLNFCCSKALDEALRDTPRFISGFPAMATRR